MAVSFIGGGNHRHVASPSFEPSAIKFVVFHMLKTKKKKIHFYLHSCMQCCETEVESMTKGYGV